MAWDENIRPLIDLLRSRTLRDRVGVWLVPSEVLGRELDYAALLGLDAVDAHVILRDMLPVGTRFASLNEEKAITVLDRICEQPRSSDCVLVFNFDLLLAALDYPVRQEVWQTLHHGFPHRVQGLLLVMPQGADHLLPGDKDLQGWEHDRRTVR